MTLTGDIGAGYETAKGRGKDQRVLLLGGFHGNASHHTADVPSAEQKHLESVGDKT